VTKYHGKPLFASAALVLLFSFRAESGTDKEQQQITVVFRFDDPSARSGAEIEDKLIIGFRAHNMRCTFGVIPFVASGDCHDPRPQELIPLSIAKIEMLRQAAQEGVIEIAQHGYSHQTCLRVCGIADFRDCQF
jgi:hypothetical protein